MANQTDSEAAAAGTAKPEASGYSVASAPPDLAAPSTALPSSSTLAHSRTIKAARAIQSSVFYGGSALLSGVNAITPHLAGAVDIMVVEQPDKSYKSSPFYVRFGKYTHLRNKDRIVQIYVNDEPIPFCMQLGAYGQAYFTVESSEVPGSGMEEESILAGLMAAPDGFDFGDEDSASINFEMPPCSQASMSHCNSNRMARTPSTLNACAAKAEDTPAQNDADVSVSGTSLVQPGAALTADNCSRRSSGSSSMGGNCSVSGMSSPGRLESPAAEANGVAKGGKGRSSSGASHAQQGKDSTPPSGPPSQGQQRILGFPENQSLPSRPSPHSDQQPHLCNGRSLSSSPGTSLLSSSLQKQQQASQQHTSPCKQQQPQSQPQQPQFNIAHPPGRVASEPLSKVSGFEPKRACSLAPQPSQRSSLAPQSEFQTCSQTSHPLEEQLRSQSSAPASEPQQPEGAFKPRTHSRTHSQQLSPRPHSPQLRRSVRGDTDSGTEGLMVSASSLSISGLRGSLEQVLQQEEAAAAAARYPSCTPTSQQQQQQQQQQQTQTQQTQQQTPRRMQQQQGHPASALSAFAPVAQSVPEQPQQQPHTPTHASTDTLGQTRRAEDQREHVRACAQHPHAQLAEEHAQAQGEGDGQVQGAADEQLHALPASHPVDTPQRGSLEVEVPEEELDEELEDEEHGSMQFRSPENFLHSPPPPYSAISPQPPQHHTPITIQPSRMRGEAPASPFVPAALGEVLEQEVEEAVDEREDEEGAALSRSAPTLPLLQPNAPLRWQTPQDLETAGSSSMPEDCYLNQARMEGLQQQAGGRSRRRHTRYVTSDSQSLCSPALQLQPQWQQQQQKQQQPQLQQQPWQQQQVREQQQQQQQQEACQASAEEQQGTTQLTVELSACGELLQPGMSYPIVRQIFEAHLISEEVWKEKGAQLMASPLLAVRVGEVVYPWSSAAPLALGLLLFGQHWPHLVPAGTTRWAPQDRSSELMHHTPRSGSRRESHAGRPNAVDGDCPALDKKAAAAVLSSWRIWPFGSWRTSDRTSKQVSQPTSPAPNPASQPSDASQADNAVGRSKTLPPPQANTATASPSPAPEQQQSPRGASPQKDRKPQPSPAPSGGLHTRKSLLPSREQISMLRLREGQNTIKFKAGTSELVAYIYFYRWCTKLVISDIDGTITRSDVLGHLLPAFGYDWSHPGITRLFTDIASNNYQMMYLSSRSVGQANITRDYINTLVQGRHRMPVGPVIISPHGLLPSLYREMILRRPHEFKIATLQEIRALFPPEWNPFYAGFGNRDTDEISYRAVSVPPARIFIINPKGELRKATLAIQSSTWNTLAAINDLVHDIFPPISKLQPLTAVPSPPRPPLLYASPPPEQQPAQEQQASAAAGATAGAAAAPPPSTTATEAAASPAQPRSPAAADNRAHASPFKQPGAQPEKGGTIQGQGAHSRKQSCQGVHSRKPSSSACSMAASMACEGSGVGTADSLCALLPQRALTGHTEDVLPVSNDEYNDLGYWSTGFSFVNPALLLASSGKGS